MVRRQVEPEEGLGEVLALWSATSADALHQVLVLHPHVRESADALEPLALLEKHHETEPETSTATAILLLTDRRWRNGLGQLVHRIADSGLLDGEHLDLLAEAFLAADRCVYWPVPDEWFSDEEFVVVSDATGDDDESTGDGPTVAARDIAPPVRRWAAAHHLSREPGAWPSLLARANELDARHGAAVVAGMLDSIDALPSAAQALLVRKGTTWPHQQVRHAAFELVAAREGVDAAFQLAHRDPNAKIRAWAATLACPRPGPPAVGDGKADRLPPAVGDRKADRLPPAESDQATLF